MQQTSSYDSHLKLSMGTLLTHIKGKIGIDPLSHSGRQLVYNQSWVGRSRKEEGCRGHWRFI